MTGTQRKARRDLKVRRPGGSWRVHTMEEGRAGILSAEAPQGGRAPADHLPPPGRRRNGRQGTTVREEVGQPRGMEEGGASFRCLRDRTEYVWPEIVSGNTRYSLDLKDAFSRNFAPLKHSSRRHSQHASEFAGAADAVNGSLKCSGVRVHAHS